MKKIIKGLALIIFVICSFYFTDLSINYSRNNSNLMKSILLIKDNYETKPIDGYIDNNTIIPGLCGKEVNVNKSYNNMLKLNSFNETYLIYNDVKPDNSLDDNKTKYIISGNKTIPHVSIIFENINTAKSINNYEINALTSDYDESSNIELINNNKNNNDYIYLDKKLSTGKDLCIINGNENVCKRNNKYLIKPNIIYYNRNSLLNTELNNGSIILVKKECLSEDIIILFNYLKSRDLEVVYLSKLINEKQE